MNETETISFAYGMKKLSTVQRHRTAVAVTRYCSVQLHDQFNVLFVNILLLFLSRFCVYVDLSFHSKWFFRLTVHTQIQTKNRYRLLEANWEYHTYSFAMMSVLQKEKKNKMISKSEVRTLLWRSLDMIIVSKNA